MQHHTTEKKEAENAFSVLKEKYGRTIHPEVYSARTIEEAIQLLSKYGKEGHVFAGGLDVLGQMKNEIISPKALINIKSIEKLKLMLADAAGLSIGSLVKIADIRNSELIKQKYPMLAETAAAIGSPHIRNMATLGGNLCQQTRCWYYRRSPDTGIAFECRRKSESGSCYAVDGENQYHAVADYGHCISVCPSDMAVTLSAMGAKVNIDGASGARSLPVSQLYSELGHVLKPEEIITAVSIPVPAIGSKQTFIKFRVRKTIDFAIVSAAVSIQTDKGIIQDAKVYLGGISHKPYRASNAENALIGEKLSPALAQHAGELTVSEMRPLSNNAYKITIAQALVKRALLEP